MERFANWITDKLVQQNIVKDEERDLYAYGFWQGIFFLLNMVAVIVIGILTNMLWQSLIFTAAYAILRSMTGGYHARTQLRCYVFSILVLLAVLSMLAWFPWSLFWGIIIAVASTITVFLLAPVEDENKPLDEVEQVIYKERSRRISLILTVIAVMLLVTKNPAIAHCIVLAIFTAAIMLVLGKIKVV